MKVLINGNKKYLWGSGDLHTSDGLIKESALKKNKGKVKTHLGCEFIALEAGFVDKLKKIKRGPAIILPKDIGEILAHTGIDQNSKIVDAGAGCGVLAGFLGRISKNVTSYERNKEFFEIAKKNFEFLGVKVKIKNKDVYDGISEKNLDLITLDLLEPWKVVKHAGKSLKNGGFFVCYLTNINQVIRLIENLDGFYLDKVIEVIEREWEVSGINVRPKNIGLLHTGFLLFARKI